MDDDSTEIAALVAVILENEQRQTKQPQKSSRPAPKIVCDAEEFRNMGWQDRFRYRPKMAWATILISTVIVLSIVLMVLL